MSAKLEWDDSITGAKLDEAIAEGLRHGAATLRDEAVERTPRDTGALRESAGAQVEGSEAAVYYTEFYAPFVHEKLNHHHTTGQAKFLESALMSGSEQILRDIADGMGRVLGG